MLSFVDVVFRELAEQRFLRKVRSSTTLNISIAFGKPLTPHLTCLNRKDNVGACILEFKVLRLPFSQYRFLIGDCLPKDVFDLFFNALVCG